MNIEKVIELARQAKLPHYYQTKEIANLDALELFASLVRSYVFKKHVDFWLKQIDKAVKAEREACAKVCDDIDVKYGGEDVLATWCAKAIRARGSA